MKKFIVSVPQNIQWFDYEVEAENAQDACDKVYLNKNGVYQINTWYDRSSESQNINNYQVRPAPLTDVYE
jgi:hypothetical protein